MPTPKSPKPIRGVFAALATPRRSESNEIDTAAFFDYQDAIMRAEVDGLVLFGATGEFVHFDISDRMQTVSLMTKRSRVPVLVNISHSTLDGALALAESTMNSDIAGLLVMPPYFYRYSDEQILAFFEQFARAIDGRTSLFLYNLPLFTNPISYRVIEALLGSGAYAGIKDSSGDRELLRQLHALHARNPFVWLAGNECLYVKARQAGAEGTISGVAGAVPELIVAIDRAVAAGAPEQTARLNGLLMEFLDWLNRFPATVAIKQTAVARGWKLNHSAFPFDTGTARDVEAFRRWLNEWLPRVLAECERIGAARVQ